jgi:drug/metabolite transporter (DMT)-like permease
MGSRFLSFYKRKKLVCSIGQFKSIVAKHTKGLSVIQAFKLLSNNTRAALLIVLATSFVAGTMILAKSLGTDRLGAALHPLQISAGRFAFAWCALMTVFAIRRPTIKSPNLKLHVTRSLLGWGGVTLMFAAAALIPLSDATAISFLNPVFAMVLAIPFLGEKVGRYRWLAAVLALIGAVVLLRPTSGTIQFAGLLALFAAALMGAELIVMKLITRKEAGFQILLLNNSIGLCISLTAALFVWQMPTAHQWMALIALGLLMVCAQTCYITAMAMADASYIAPFSYMTLVFAALYDFAIFAQVPDQFSILGAALILTGAVLLAWRENLHRAARN